MNSLVKKKYEHEIDNEKEDDTHSIHLAQEEEPSRMDKKINKLEQLLNSSQLFDNQFIDQTLYTSISKGTLLAKFSLYENIKFMDLATHLLI